MDADSPPRKRRLGSWLRWLGLGSVAAIAVVAAMISVRLRDHADERRQMMEELTNIEVAATAHSMAIWRAMTMLMADEKMGFIRIRGEVQVARNEIHGQLDRLVALDESGEELNQLLGFPAEPSLVEDLKGRTESFLGGVQGALGQMNLSAERVRKRLKYWDMNFGAFEESLNALKARNAEIAVASGRVARRVTTAAGLARLIASAMLVLTLSRLRRTSAAAVLAAGEVSGAGDSQGPHFLGIAEDQGLGAGDAGAKLQPATLQPAAPLPSTR